MYLLPHALRADLARPMGPVLPTEEAIPQLREGGLVIAVGDVVTRTLMENGITPAVAVVDYKTERREDRGIEAHILRQKLPVIAIENPPGRITSALWEALVSALHATVPVIVHVTEGEEDLAVLPAILLAPAGSRVVYGQPPATDLGVGEGGMVVVEVTPATRLYVHRILHRMEVEDHGN